MRRERGIKNPGTRFLQKGDELMLSTLKRFLGEQRKEKRGGIG